jgi:oligosaccharyltransferase complex subunit delta (ribophorin II)
VLDQNVPFDTKDSLKIVLTAKEGGDGKRPHQAFLMLKDKPTGLETAFPFKVKETGKAIVEIVRHHKSDIESRGLTALQTQKDLPVQFLTASEPLQATIILASFGEASPLQHHVFNLNVQADANAPAPKYEKPLRYGILPEIHHIFKSDPTSPPKVISIFFVFAILATVPVLIGSVSTSDF